MEHDAAYSGSNLLRASDLVVQTVCEATQAHVNQLQSMYNATGCLPKLADGTRTRSALQLDDMVIVYTELGW